MAGFVSTLADVSTIWLVILSFLLCLLPLALVGGLVFGMRKVLIALPPILQRGQTGMAAVADGADKASRKIAAPFIAVSAFSSQVKELSRRFVQIGRRKA